MTNPTLSDIKINECCKVIKINGNENIKRRLLDMGICRNTHIEVIRKAIFNDPIIISLRGFKLTLRKDECDLIEVEKL